jgi:hypothetical protein
MSNWHQEPAASALIAQLDASRVDRVKCIAIPADYYAYVGADDGARGIFTQLEGLRTAAIERTLGCSFEEACADAARRDEVLAILGATPHVSVVIGEAI